MIGWPGLPRVLVALALSVGAVVAACAPAPAAPPAAAPAGGARPEAPTAPTPAAAAPPPTAPAADPPRRRLGPAGLPAPAAQPARARRGDRPGLHASRGDLRRGGPRLLPGGGPRRRALSKQRCVGLGADDRHRPGGVSSLRARSGP